MGLTGQKLRDPPTINRCLESNPLPNTKPPPYFRTTGALQLHFSNKMPKRPTIVSFRLSKCKDNKKIANNKKFLRFCQLFFVFDNIVVTKPAEPTSHIQKKNKSCDLSSLVGLCINLSDLYLAHYRCVIAFYKWLLKRRRKYPPQLKRSIL